MPGLELDKNVHIAIRSEIHSENGPEKGKPPDVVLCTKPGYPILVNFYWQLHALTPSASLDESSIAQALDTAGST